MSDIDKKNHFKRPQNSKIKRFKGQMGVEKDSDAHMEHQKGKNDTGKS